MKKPVDFFFASFAALLALLFSSAANAAEPRSIAVISLIGDSVRVVGQEATTGSRINRNPVDALAVTFEMLELPSLRAATAAVLKADTISKAAPMKITDAAVYAAQGNMVSGSRAQIPTEILTPLRAAKISHLVLISRFRDDAQMNTGRLMLGSGKVEGVGLYLDTETPIVLIAGGAKSVGFLAPFVYLRASLIDVETLAILSSQTSTQGVVVTASETESRGGPWEILNTEQKITRLRSMVEAQVTDAVTRAMK
jgi:hypothetical protein